MMDKILEIIKMIISWLCKKQDVAAKEADNESEKIKAAQKEAHDRIMRELEEINAELGSLNKLISARMIQGASVAAEFNRRRDMIEKQHKLEKELEK